MTSHPSKPSLLAICLFDGGGGGHTPISSLVGRGTNWVRNDWRAVDVTDAGCCALALRGLRVNWLWLMRNSIPSVDHLPGRILA